MKVELPRHLRAKRLADGSTAYFFEVPTRYRRAGCPITSEALGCKFGKAIARAEELNQDFDAWRRGEDQAGPRHGTVAWLRREYEMAREFTTLREATQRRYFQSLNIIEHGWRGKPALGAYRLDAIGRKQARAWYRLLQEPAAEGEPPRLEQANKTIRMARVLWEYGMNEEHVAANPWRWTLDHVETNVVNWTTEQIECAITTADELGYKPLGTAITLAFELAQRQGDVLRLPWSAAGDDNSITVKQSKTGTTVVLPASHMLIRRLETVPRVGSLIVMVERNGVWLPYNAQTLRFHLNKVLDAAGLPRDLQFYRLRHAAATDDVFHMKSCEL